MRPKKLSENNRYLFEHIDYTLEGKNFLFHCDSINETIINVDVLSSQTQFMLIHSDFELNLKTASTELPVFVLAYVNVNCRSLYINNCKLHVNNSQSATNRHRNVHMLRKRRSALPSLHNNYDFRISIHMTSIIAEHMLLTITSYSCLHRFFSVRIWFA